MSKILCYKIKLETVGPLHIGSGQRLERADYILNKNTIYVIDPVKLFNGLNSLNMLSEFEKEVIGAPRANMTMFVRSNGIKPDEYKKWSSYSYNITQDTDVKNMQIMTCVKDAYNLPYIPGSSLKGCIRNALLNHKLLNVKWDKLADSVEQNATYMKSRKAYLSNEAKSAELPFRTHNLNKGERAGITNDIFKGIRVSDSKPLTKDDIILCRKIDITPDGKRHSLPLLRECIKPGTIIEFTLEIDSTVFTYSIDAVIAAIKAFYGNQQRCFISKYPRIASDNISGNLIYLGGGSGFVSKTAVYSLFKDERKALKVASVILDNVDSKNKGKKVGKHLSDPSVYGVSPHTRKCTLYNNSLYDFGLCKIDFQPID